MDAKVTRLYPIPTVALTLEGLYLRHDLHQRAEDARPCIYSNFVASLDGRIAAANPRTGRRPIPAAIRDPRDWRLYLELAAQADAVLISGRHWRELRSAGRALESVRGLAAGDLAEWRRDRALPPQPACLVLTQSLELPLPGPHLGGAVTVLTGTNASPERIRQLRTAGLDLVVGSAARVSGGDVQRVARERGYRTVYAIAGPEVLQTLAAAGVLDRLYLTLALRLLSGGDFDTLLHGPALAPPVGLRLHQLYLADADAARAQLLLASFEREPAARATSSRE